MPEESLPFAWREHTALLVGAATSGIVCLKLLAVSHWDLNTAFGILSANGTANVLTGTLLAMLPILFGFFAFFVTPHIERRIPRRTPAERGIARLVEFWPGYLLSAIVPLPLFLTFIAYFVILPFLVFIWRKIRLRLRKSRVRRTSSTNQEKGPARLEVASVTMAVVAVLSYGSLSTPWVTPEIIIAEGDEQTAFVFDRSGDEATVLLEQERKIVHVDPSQLTNEYCRLSQPWLSSSLVALLLYDPYKYPSCPG